MNITDWLVAMRFLLRARRPENTCVPNVEEDVVGRALSLTLGATYYRFSEERGNLIHPVPVAEFPRLIEIWKLDWAVGIAPRALAAYINVKPKTLAFEVLERFKPKYDKLEAYRHLFSELLDQGAPRHSGDTEEDWAFALERLDGANPMVIARATEEQTQKLAKHLRDDDLKVALKQEAKLQDEIAAGNIFVADYHLLARSLLPQGPLGRDSRWRHKYLPAPLAVFLRRPGFFRECELVPIAIFIDQPGCRQPNPLYIRGTTGWDIAKTYVRVADANLHENVSHNTRHHFIANAFALATRRRLAMNHPIHVLLEPHLAHTLMVNSVIYNTLATRNKSTEKQFAGDLAESRQQMIEAWQLLNWPELLLEGDLKLRNVDQMPEKYPWRDDLLLWPPVIEKFVRSYVESYYVSDAALRRDPELQKWLSELAAPSGGGLRSVIDDPPTVDGLIRLLSGFLFIAGPSHAAVHFSLKDWLKWAPAFPRAAYAPPPAIPSVNDKRDAVLPPATRAAEQFQVGHLSGHRYGTFGDYRKYRLGRLPAAQSAIQALQDDLSGIAREIDQRNGERVRPYRYVHPCHVPNSINL